MTEWVGDISDDGTEMDVYDHNNEHITTVENDGGGFGKQDVRDVAFDAMDGNQPSAYNQTLIACIATNQIEIIRPESGDTS